MTTTLNEGRAAVTDSWQSVREVRRVRAIAAIEELAAARLALPIPELDASNVELWADQVQKALIAARLGAWWRLLAGLTHGTGVPAIYARAAYTAWAGEQRLAQLSRDRAQFWAEHARAAEWGDAEVAGESR